MKMILEIFENNEKVGEIITTSEAEIYKRLAQIYFIKDNKRATRTTIRTKSYEILSITQVFDQTFTQLPNTTCIYKYTFKEVRL